VPHPARVVVLQPNRLFREALAAALEHEPDIEVVATVPGVAALRDRLSALDCCIFLVVAGAPGLLPLSDVQEIGAACPRGAVVAVGLPPLDAEVISACEAGATGYMLEDAGLAELLHQVRAAASGETPCSPRVAALLFARLRQRARELQQLQVGELPRLTRRELQVVALIDHDLSNKEIAVRLGIEVQTVKNHVHNILEKLELDGRQAAVKYIRERGMMPALVPRQASVAEAAVR
jgi:DNA-binding NarL/FixJ family response regulator